MPTYQDIVDCYKTKIRPHADWELSEFSAKGPLSHAIQRAALCLMPDGRTFPHQHRIPKDSLRKAAAVLADAGAEMAACSDFEELYGTVSRRIRDIHMIGDLTIYDIAHRIGVNLGIQPQSVYLHRGTAEGIRILGLLGFNGRLDVDDLPEAFRQLSPNEIEGCLYLFKRELKAISREGEIACKANRRPCRSCIEEKARTGCVVPRPSEGSMGPGSKNRKGPVGGIRPWSV